jgi:hypothetical protein
MTSECLELIFHSSLAVAIDIRFGMVNHLMLEFVQSVVGLQRNR